MPALIEKPKQQINIQQGISDFLAFVQAGIDAWEKAGAKLIELLEADEDIYEKIIGASKNRITVGMLTTFERIGRKDLYPPLLVDESDGAKRVLKLGLPYEKQIALYEKPIEVAVAKNGEVVTELKRLNELTPEEARRVITDEGAAEPEHQTEVIIAKQKEAHARQTSRYLLEKDRVTFFAQCTMTRADLEEILARLKPATAEEIQDAIAANQVTGSL